MDLFAAPTTETTATSRAETRPPRHSRRHFLRAAGLASLAIALLPPPALRSETEPSHSADDPPTPPFPSTSLVDRYGRAFQFFAAGDEELGIAAFNHALAESETARLPAIAVDRIRQLVALTDAADLHDRLPDLHITRGGLEWLPESDRIALLDQIDSAYRNGLRRVGSAGQEERARSYLATLQEIRDSVRFCGVHWPHPRKEYADGTPFVERVMCFAGDQEEFHREAVRVRIQRLRDSYPASPIILRIDYRPAIAIPRNDAERDEYYPRLAEIMGAPEFAGIMIQQGNEPQLEGSPTPEVLAREFNGWGTPPEDTRNFWMTAAIHNPNAPRLPPALAAFNPIGPDEPNPAGLEDSPWARLAYRTKSLIVGVGRERDRLPHAWSEHVYGDPVASGGPLEPWDEPVDSHGYRWQTNVADTWHQVNRAVELENGIAPMDVWVTEYNTAARGVEGANAPEASYTGGWMFNAIARMAVSLPTLRGACWFVGDAEAHNNSWATFALHERRGQLANAEDDFYDLLDAGF
ncbi:MAG: hypothetical protein QF719_04520 [Chloroflexota bacterium]|jgi:hypothetical protein|nr:hypothetical protein [Chloroflexota bacterium]MDP6757462.1 hypothetical protein [Chloroflexota bacterium]